MPDELILDGQVVGTGLLVPTSLMTSFPLYETSGPMMSLDDIIAVAKQRPKFGRGFFDKTWIKNQRHYGSCQGFASAAAVSRARKRRGLDRVDLSGAYAYSLVNGGQDRGSMLEDGMVACQRGYATEATVPWNKVFRSSYNTSVADAEAARFKAFEVYAASTEIELFSGLAAGFDAVVAVHADNGFMRLDGRGVAGGGNGPGNHAVGADDLWWDGGLVAAGYNSWDVTYGFEGKMGLTWSQHFRTTSQNHRFYLIRSTEDDPQGVNPPAAV